MVTKSAASLTLWLSREIAKISCIYARAGYKKMQTSEFTKKQVTCLLKIALLKTISYGCPNVIKVGNFLYMKIFKNV